MQLNEFIDGAAALLRHTFSRTGMMKRLLGLAALLVLTSILLTGCNTARGFGEDIKHLGNSISHAAS